MPGKQAKMLSIGDVNDLLVFASCTRCVSAWNKDPVFGVIGIQSGPRG